MSATKIYCESLLTPAEPGTEKLVTAFEQTDTEQPAAHLPTALENGKTEGIAALLIQCDTLKLVSN